MHDSRRRAFGRFGRQTLRQCVQQSAPWETQRVSQFLAWNARMNGEGGDVDTVFAEPLLELGGVEDVREFTLRVRGGGVVSDVVV